MKECVLPLFDDLSHRASFLFLGAVLGLGIPIARAQSSVTVKVETYHGALISGARVVANRLHLPKKASEKPVVLEALDVPEKKRGTYTADRLVNGDYELFACDDGLNHSE